MNATGMADEAGERRRVAALAGHAGDEGAARALLADADASVRATALAALHRCDALTSAELRDALRDPSPVVRRRAAELAARTAAGPDGDGCDVDLVPLLADDDTLVVEAAAYALGEHPPSPEVVAALSATATSHADALCREAAVAALGALGDPAGLPAILRATEDKPAVRRRAVLALAPFEGPEVDAAVQRALTDRDWQVRQAAEDLQ
ncbi:MAG TPA: HEAT repeat domain-containing protein [Acidimicrobiales bacterium]